MARESSFSYIDLHPKVGRNTVTSGSNDARSKNSCSPPHTGDLVLLCRRNAPLTYSVVNEKGVRVRGRSRRRAHLARTSAHPHPSSDPSLIDAASRPKRQTQQTPREQHHSHEAWGAVEHACIDNHQPALLQPAMHETRAKQRESWKTLPVLPEKSQ